MPDVNRDEQPMHTEGEHRLHAIVRALLSSGVWLVLAAQMALAFSLQWHAPATAGSEASLLPVLLATISLMLFLYLQAGTYQALALGRRTVSALEIVQAGKAVFSAFIWLTVKAGLLLVLVLNVLLYLSLLVSGQELKTVLAALSPYFGPLLGVLAFAFVYWLPFVFVRREFRLLPSLKAALQVARTRLSRSAFLALLVLVPVVVSASLPADIPVLLDFTVSLVSGIMGWMAYISCAEVLQEAVPETPT